MVERDGHFKHLEDLLLEGVQLGWKESDPFALENLESFDTAKGAARSVWIR